MLKACLQALALSNTPVTEAVVSDDGSTPENVALMQAGFAELPFPVRYVSQPDRGYRLAAARNNAVRNATGEYLLMLDCDILLMPDTLSIHLSHARPGRFLAANRAWADESATRKYLERELTPAALEELWYCADQTHIRRAHCRFKRNACLRHIGLARRNKPKILGCHFSLFRADYEKINGFDENFEGWGLEDDDFATRLHLVGIRGRSLIRSARAVHLWHPVVASCPRTLAESPNYLYYRRKHVEPFCRRGLIDDNS